ncbi:hypothetical protein ACQPYK_47970 [Streptosporangium sp. CA-135522]|uniref:hypothetical protein n=1 Tax=Streptosporangium sp. CA-135522 TaxID=3240072 RepID=UPI003D8A7E15
MRCGPRWRWCSPAAPYGKSDAALRTIRIPDSVVLTLKRRMKGVPDRELIFTAPRGGGRRALGRLHTPSTGDNSRSMA